MKKAFTLGGKPITIFKDYNDFDKIKKMLDKLPFGEFITTTTLADKLLTHNNSYFQHKLKAALKDKLKDNYIYYRSKLIFGSEKTVKEYKELTEQI